MLFLNSRRPDEEISRLETGITEFPQLALVVSTFLHFLLHNLLDEDPGALETVLSLQNI